MGEHVIRGLGVSPGVVCAPWLRFGSQLATSPQDPVGGSVEDELARVKEALGGVADEMQARAARVSGVAAEILSMSATMARDPGIVAATEQQLGDGMPTAHAVHLAFEGFCAKLEALGGYMAERATDLRDIGGRTVAVLLGEPMPGIPAPGHPFVLVARDLAPADTAMLGDSDVVGLLTTEGGPTSHTAILAKSLGLPAVVNCPDTDRLVEDAPVLLDGGTGDVVIDPSPLRQQAAIEQAAADAARLAAASGPGRTADGTPVQLLVNIGTVDDAAKAGPEDSEGVGLFRTEFMYLGKASAPGLDEQIASYTAVLEQFAGRKVVVRTLDAGSDKPAVPRSGDRGESRAGCARAADRDGVPGYPGHPAHRAGAGPGSHRCRSVGDGADGRHRRRGGRIRHARTGIRVADRRRDDRDPGGGATGQRSADPPRFRQYRHQRSQPVHVRGRPDGRRARAPARSVAARGARSDRHGRRGGVGGREAGRGVW